MQFITKQLFYVLILLTSISLMTSCSQLAEEQAEDNVPEYAQKKNLVLPVGYASEDQMVLYLENVSKETVVKLEESFRVANFLKENDLFEAARATMAYGDHFADLDLSELLDARQLNAFENYMPNVDADSRWCGTSTGWCYITTCCGAGGYPVCWTTWGIC